VLNATDETLRAYEQRADRYFDASAPAVSAEVAGLLDAVVARLRPGSHVLEVGTGPGREAAYLEERGLHVDRTDATAAFGILGGMSGCANSIEFRYPDGTVYRPHLKDIVADIPAGTVYHQVALTLKDGDGESWSDAKLGAPRWFVYWREEALRAQLSEAGWRVLDLRHVPDRTEPWLHTLCER